MGALLGVTGPQAAAVVIAAVVVFAVLLLVVRLLGARAAARLTTADLAVLLIVGSIAGRVVLGTAVTLAAGVIALAVLIALRLTAGLLRRRRAGHVLVTDRPLLLVAAGRVLDAHLHRAKMGREELNVALRTAGIAALTEVACAVLEPTGAISVTRRDPAHPLDRSVFTDVRGIELIPGAWFEEPVAE
ncbi:MAG: DUF421 domain-containing protein [Amnibacterium sp.]